MSIYQIDLGLLKESEETYRESATELETYIAEATEEIGKVTEEVYAGDDADKLRDGISKHITGYFSDTKDMAVKVAQKLSLAHSMGQLCKKRCYDFIIALGGSGGGKPADCFTGLLYCDQEKITALKQTCTTTMQYGDLLKGKANTVKGLLDMLQMVTLDSSGYVGRIKTSCDKIDHLEEYSLELTKYAEYVEKMDESLQTGLKECMPEDYVMTADGVDDRQKYLDMEYDITNSGEISEIEKSYIDELLMKIGGSNSDANISIENIQSSPVYLILLDSEYNDKAFTMAYLYEKAVLLYGETFAIGLMANVWHEGNWGMIEGNWGNDYWNNVNSDVLRLAFTNITCEEDVEILLEGIPEGTEGIGVGALQWSGDRRVGLLNMYKECANTYSQEELSVIEVAYMMEELSGNGKYAVENYSWIVKKCENKNSAECAWYICTYYEAPENSEDKAKGRVDTAKKIEELLMIEKGV